MRAGHHDVVRVAALRLGDDVVDGDVLRRVDPHGGRRTRLGERRAVGEGCPNDRDSGRRRRKRADDEIFAQGRVSLVEDDHGQSTRSLRVQGLDREGAGSPLDQRDVAGREACEISGLAPARAGPRRHEVDVDGRHGRGDVPEACTREGAGLVGGDNRGGLLQHRGRDEQKGKAVERHVVACRCHLLGDVLDAPVVTGSAGQPSPAVGVRDRLERGLVRAHAFQRHALGELCERVVDAVRARG